MNSHHLKHLIIIASFQSKAESTFLYAVVELTAAAAAASCMVSQSACNQTTMDYSI